MVAGFHHVAFFQYINSVGMHDGGKPVCNQNSDLVPFDEKYPVMVSVISSSVNESSAEVASSNNNNLGLRKALAIDKPLFFTTG